MYLSLKIFRIGISRWKLYFLALPFVKIVWDMFSGIPKSSLLHHGIDLMALPAKHGYITLGFGFSEYGPSLDAMFSVKDPSGNRFSASLADYIAALLAKKIDPLAPRFVLATIVCVSAVLLLIRLYNYVSFELRRKRDRINPSTQTIRTITTGPRSVDIYASEGYSGTPFTGGIFRPFICVPKSTLSLLTPAEFDAVIEHEMAHVRSFDLPITLIIKILGDIFWFVPGYRFLSRKIDRLREILADQAASSSRTCSLGLASALVKLKDIEIDCRHSVLYSALFREKSLLEIRVNRLIGDEHTTKPPRLGWHNRWIKIVIIAWTTGGVMVSTFGGNHEIQTLPAWVERLLKAWGLM